MCVCRGGGGGLRDHTGEREGGRKRAWTCTPVVIRVFNGECERAWTTMLLRNVNRLLQLQKCLHLHPYHLGGRSSTPRQ